MPRPDSPTPTPAPAPGAQATAQRVVDRARPEAFRFAAIGAPWAITTRAPLPATVSTAILERIERFDRTYSRFRRDSLVSRIAEIPGRYEFPEDAPPLFDLYRRLYDVTGGSVSPLVGRRLEHLGYDRDYSFSVSPDPAGVPAWDDAVRWDGTNLTTTAPVVLDVGAAGKGYLVDLVAGILDEAEILDYVVDGSGDLRHRGDDPARVALENPFDASLAIGVVELSNAALCASAPNRRTWGHGLHHIIDAATGEPTADVAATWALAPTALEADGLATALFFASNPELSVDFDVESVRLFANGRLDVSAHFQGELFA